MATRVKINRKALAEILKATETRAAVHAAGEHVAERAREKSKPDMDIRVIDGGHKRARTYVSIASAAYEVAHRPIMSSV